MRKGVRHGIIMTFFSKTKKTKLLATTHPMTCTFLFLHVVGSTASLVNCKDGYIGHKTKLQRKSKQNHYIQSS